MVQIYTKSDKEKNSIISAFSAFLGEAVLNPPFMRFCLFLRIE
jgi:hypothetical protein